MRTKLLLFLLLCCGLLFTIISCQRENELDIPKAPTVAQLAAVTFSGRVVDERNLPVAGARVMAGNAVKTTDINGSFKFTNVMMDKNVAFVKAEKEGYFTGSRTWVAQGQSSNFAEIELIPNKVIGTIPSGSGGTVAVPSGGSIVFQPNGIINAASKAAYTGTVSVAAFFLDPTKSNFNSIMPGDLRGITTNNQETGMQSFGMMAVELTGASGEKLQLAGGKGAVVTFPIPSSLQAQAPASIPLWHFDEAKGLWQEEGSAIKQGSNYVGSVSHFSFWNVDVPFELVDFEAQLKDQHNQPLSFCKVVIQTEEDKESRMGYGITDSAGHVWGKVPKNKKLILSAYNSCNTLVYTKNMGAFAGKASFGTITVNNPEAAGITFTGTVKDCNAAGITNGFVNVFINGSNHRAAVSNGNFSITISSCSGNTGVPARLYAYDATSNTASDSVLVTVNGANAPVVDLKACAFVVTKSIQYNLDGKDFAFVAPADSIAFYPSSRDNMISGSVMGTNSSISFRFTGTTTGTFPLQSLNIYNNNRSYSAADTIRAVITQYNAAEGLIEGSFTGQVRADSSNTRVPVNCTFKIKR